MIEIKSKKKSYGIRIPSSIREITPEVLNTSGSLKTERRFWRTSSGTKNAGFAPAV